MAGHVVLLGDSIFDNRAYTGVEPDVVSHLRAVLPEGWRASLCAVDGSTTAGLPAQLERIPADASHLVVSIGGNDALGHSDLLALPVQSTTEALALFGERVEEFEAYANPIEPSGPGGLKIARTIAGTVGAYEGTVGRCVVFSVDSSGEKRKICHAGRCDL